MVHLRGGSVVRVCVCVCDTKTVTYIRTVVLVNAVRVSSCGGSDIMHGMRERVGGGEREEEERNKKKEGHST